MSSARPRGTPTTSVKLYWLLKHDPSISYHEAASLLGVSYAAVRQAAYRLRQEGIKITRYCPNPLEPTVVYEGGQYVCSKCGIVLHEEFHDEIERPDLARANASSLIQVDKGLGMNCEAEK